ncbi:type II secretion system major pseudopilin GspG [Desulfonema magnum]|uniref:Type II secretion system core protein G n=1 Tax=Desulfonema magnum TaxID=45655 RepID=A0A975BXY6_9BACT|nr:type II secretion system major pseudopilin GspG [Desulfonema magnum]QTA93220.1 Putative general secretion pathway protein G, GspG-like [Desulfonema magnum]
MSVIKKILPKATNNSGFTLIELMVVIVILGILAGLIVPKVMDKPGEAKQAAARIDIKALESALKFYKLHHGTYPTTEQGLQALVEPPTGGASINSSKYPKGGYLEKSKVPTDSWGNEFIYLSPGVHGDIDIISYGADGVPEGEGENADINSWEIE